MCLDNLTKVRYMTCIQNALIHFLSIRSSKGGGKDDVILHFLSLTPTQQTQGPSIEMTLFTTVLAEAHYDGLESLQSNSANKQTTTQIK